MRLIDADTLEVQHGWFDQGYFCGEIETDVVYYEDIINAPTVDAVPCEFLERYAEWFCALVSYPEFIREAKQFYFDSCKAEEGGVISDAD